jgi:hypothetical protein
LRILQQAHSSGLEGHLPQLRKLPHRYVGRPKGLEPFWPLGPLRGLLGAPRALLGSLLSLLGGTLRVERERLAR